MAEKADAIICGAGIAGITTAYYLAERHGITDIVLVDKHAPMSQTTAKSGENYRNWWPHPAMVDLTNRSIDLMAEIADQTDNVIQMHGRGYLYATRQSDTDAFIRQTQEVYDSVDVGAIRVHTAPTYQSGEGETGGADILVDPDLITRYFPHLSSEITAVLHTRRGGAISVQQLGAVLLERLKGLGGRELRGEVTDIAVDSRGVKQVTVSTANDVTTIDTRCCVNAAGPFAAEIAAFLGESLPIHTVFQQKIAVQDPLKLVPRDAPFTIYLDGQSIDWPSDEQALLASDPDFAWLVEPLPGGLHVRPEGTGESTWIKLGWAINRTPSSPRRSHSGSDEFPELVMRGATQLIPGLSAYVEKLSTPVVHYGGYYTKTRENIPLIGPMTTQGAFIVGALSGFGTMAACAAGELCADSIAGAAQQSYSDLFLPSRLARNNAQIPPSISASVGEL